MKRIVSDTLHSLFHAKPPGGFSFALLQTIGLGFLGGVLGNVAPTADDDLFRTVILRPGGDLHTSAGVADLADNGVTGTENVTGTNESVVRRHIQCGEKILCHFFKQLRVVAEIDGFAVFPFERIGVGMGSINRDAERFFSAYG